MVILIILVFAVAMYGMYLDLFPNYEKMSSCKLGDHEFKYEIKTIDFGYPDPGHQETFFYFKDEEKYRLAFNVDFAAYDPATNQEILQLYKNWSYYGC